MGEYTGLWDPCWREDRLTGVAEDTEFLRPFFYEVVASGVFRIGITYISMR